MLPLFTKLLKDYLVRQNIVPADRVSLGPPDRTFVNALQPGQSISIYLADIRENRKLRSNERAREGFKVGADNNVRESLYPAWLDAHYIITAWDTSVDQSIRAVKEHQLLADVSATILAGDPFTPREVYPDPTDEQLLTVQTLRDRARTDALAAGATIDEVVRAGDNAADAERKRITDLVLAPLTAWPEEFRLPGLPYQILPPEGFSKLSEFWTTMGVGSVWKPVIYLVAAIPVALKPRFEFPMVTTLKTTTGQTANAPGRQLIRGTEREWYQIGGYVSTQATDRDREPMFNPDRTPVIVPVKRAKAILQAAPPANTPLAPPLPLQETRTDDDGRYQFLFGGLLSGDQTRFQVVVQASGLKADPLDVVLSPAEPFPHNVIMQPI
jgi:hypothetical protein